MGCSKTGGIKDLSLIVLGVQKGPGSEGNDGDRTED